MMAIMEQAAHLGAMGVPAPRESSEPQWKQVLNQALQKHNITDKPEYETAEGGNRKYVATVTIEGQIYNSEELAPNKKAAEQAAAKAAVKELYPDEFQKKAMSGSRKPGKGSMMMPVMMEESRGKKRGKEHPGNDNPKQRLLNVVQLLVFKKHQRNITSDDLSWEIQEFDGEQGKTYQGSVTITVHEPGKSYTGEVSESKKNAEWAAATIAYDHLKEIFGELEEEHKEKKRKKNKEEVQKLKDRALEKKLPKEPEMKEEEIS